MDVPRRSQALREAARRLGELLKTAVAVPSNGPGSVSRKAAALRAGGRTYALEWRASGDVAAVAAGVRNLVARRNRGRGAPVLLLAVPFMGEAGQRVCAGSDVSWLDLSGNARIVAPGVHVHVEGRVNRFRRRGRPSNPFAPKSSRVARWLLLHQDRFHLQREMARATGMGEGFVSRVVRRLEGLGLIERNEEGAVRARDPRLLREAWAERYDFERHHLVRGHLSARSGEERLTALSTALSRHGIEHAATGLAGAWLLTRFAAFRTVTCYVAELPEGELLERLGYHGDERGANLWLALPADEGVFHGAQLVDGLRCANPVQVWLDLRSHPERAADAARHLEEVLLGGTSRG